MNVSYNWLQSFFNEQSLPSPEKIEELFNLHSFEVDGVEKHDEDIIFDVKVLANRGHDCLCHLGLARELSAVAGLPRPSQKTFSQVNIGQVKNQVVVDVLDDRCSRYLAQAVEGVVVGDSPDWLKKFLESIGQKSINSIVDAANFVMFDMGQPLHVFDADKVKGKIRIRGAEKDESIITLDDNEIFLERGMLVIADEIGPIAIAGIKGGKRTEVDKNTKNIIIEAANFQAGDIRQTATKLGLRTDALKRFENGLVPELALAGLTEIASLIFELCNQANPIASEVVDIYPDPTVKPTVEFSVSKVNSLLGLDIAESEMIEILNNLGIEVKKEGDNLVAISPIERRDLVGVEDIAEEVGRIRGYQDLPSKPLPALDQNEARSNSAAFDYANKLKEIFVANSFSEGCGYVFTNSGEVEVIKPLASDKSFLRTNLLDGLKERTDFNLKNILFDNEAVKLFVVGNIFTDSEEQLHLGVSYAYRSKNKNFGSEVEEFIGKVFAELGVKLTAEEALRTKGVVVNRIDESNKLYLEINVDELMKLPQETKKANLDRFVVDNKFETISPYPSIVRDIAVWVNPEVLPIDVAKIIENNVGELCVRGPILFDLFEKKDATGRVERKSIAFRTVFQSFERTLSIDEVNKIIDEIISIIETHDGFEVRK